MKNLQKLSVILLAISFITLFITISYSLITENKNEIFLYVIELSILLALIAFGAVMFIEDKIK